MRLLIFCFVFFVLTISSIGQEKKCFLIDDIVKNTLKALEQKNVDLYLEMWNKEKFVEAIKQDTTSDKAEYLIKNIDKLVEVHKKDFSALLKQMKAQLFTDVYQITFIKYDDVMQQKDGKLTNHVIEIMFVINGVTRKINAPLSEYEGCFYYFEPIGDMLKTN